MESAECNEGEGMSIAMYFVPERFPRTIGRKEWKEIWRWKRVTQKRLIEEVAKEQLMLSVYGSTMPDYARCDLIERMIFPPLLVHDKMDMSYKSAG